MLIYSIWTLEISIFQEVALVTGASKGIGRAIAIRLAQTGMLVAVTARTRDALDETVELIKTDNGNAIAFPADVTDQPAVNRIVAGTHRQFGPSDLLVNNAAIPGAPGPDWENDSDLWWRAMEINIRGPFIVSRAVLPGMIEQRKGRIVNVSSSSAYLSSPYLSSYTASKAALTNWTLSLADATREYGIKVFAYSPTLVATEMTEIMSTSPDLPESHRAVMIDALEDRAQPPSVSAEGVVYLASGKADVLNGHFVDVRWGIDEMIKRYQTGKDPNLYTLQVLGRMS